MCFLAYYNDGKDTAWVEKDTVTGGTLGGVKRPSGKGLRLIILGAGGEMGWIPNTTLIFRSKKNTGDYHDKRVGIILRSGLGINCFPIFHLIL